MIPAALISGWRSYVATFGEGMILNSKMEGGDEMVDVFFESVGLKKLMIGFAKLEVIE